MKTKEMLQNEISQGLMAGKNKVKSIDKIMATYQFKDYTGLEMYILYQNYIDLLEGYMAVMEYYFNTNHTDKENKDLSIAVGLLKDSERFVLENDIFANAAKAARLNMSAIEFLDMVRKECGYNAYKEMVSIYWKHC